MRDDVVLLYVTYPDVDIARRVSSTLVEESLVACANIFPAHESLFFWDGCVQSEAEVAVIYKHERQKFVEIEKKILSQHPYDVPCLVALPVVQGHAPFLQWVQSSSDVPVV